MNSITLGDKKVGPGNPCLIVFEAGPTIYDFESGKKLCKAAAKAGADAIKFQIMDVDRLMGDKSVEFTYGTADGDVTETLYDILKRRELPLDKWRKIKEYCDELGILFFSTALFPEEVDFLKDVESCAIKIAAADINHLYLIEYAAKSGLPIILDARGSEKELDIAVDTCKKAGCEQLMIMHCPPGYPCKDEEVNMSVMQYLKDKYKCPVGFSDHSINALMNYAAIGYGADCVEVTITLDKTTRSAEHYMSLEPDELKEFVINMRKIEAAIGSPSDVFTGSPALVGRRSLVAANNLKKGTILTEADIDFQRPGNKIPANLYKKYIGKELAHDVQKDCFLKPDDFNEN